jgi:integrase
VQAWSADEAMAFLDAAGSDPLYPTFVLLQLDGMRRGEVLGLRWVDVDLAVGKLSVRQQLQRIRGTLRGPGLSRHVLEIATCPAQLWRGLRSWPAA